MSRKILVMAHMGRQEAKDAARDSCLQLHEAGLVPVISRDDLEALQEDAVPLAPVEVIEEDVSLREIELVMVLGGDGSILRAAELVRSVDTPLLGVNLGHVGFLAESERSDLRESVEAIVDGRYTVEQGDREKMVEVVIEVDRRPLSTFGCDGVVLATPTGSTAYAFSAGGPVVWPEVEALLMVPLSAHALFARPLVISPNSMMAVEVLTRTDARGVLWCDGRRTTELPPGSRIEVVRSPKAVNLARMHRTPFSERLVKKFELPTSGWRGPVPPHEAAAARTTALPTVRGDQTTGAWAQELQKSTVGHEMPHVPDAPSHRTRDETGEDG